MKLRGVLTFVLIGLSLILCDPVQRFVIGPWVWLRPSSRIPVLGKWIHAMAWLTTRPLVILGGATIPRPPTIPCEPGILIIMNHQSLLDIPTVVTAVSGGYPRIVARKRYLRWIPLISHMVRLYQHPVVNPTANPGEGPRMIGSLQEAASTADVPIAIFPEGTRTRNGEIGRFRTTGLNLILRARPWTVHVLVTDGFWHRAKFRQFLWGISDIRGRVEFVDRFEWTDPEADPKPFIAEIRERMIEHLAQMREATAA